MEPMIHGPEGFSIVCAVPLCGPHLVFFHAKVMRNLMPNRFPYNSLHAFGRHALVKNGIHKKRDRGGHAPRGRILATDRMALKETEERFVLRNAVLAQLVLGRIVLDEKSNLPDPCAEFLWDRRDTVMHELFELRPRHFRHAKIIPTLKKGCERAIIPAMEPRTALKVIFIIALIGVIFSGTLTYQELFAEGGISCPAPGAPGTVFGYPACVYGFFMYFGVAVIAGLGLRRKY